MKKAEFLTKLRQALDAAGVANVDSIIQYYDELIYDCMEEGISEENAVASLGSIEEIVKKSGGEVKPSLSYAGRITALNDSSNVNKKKLTGIICVSALAIIAVAAMMIGFTKGLFKKIVPVNLNFNEETYVATESSGITTLEINEFSHKIYVYATTDKDISIRYKIPEGYPDNVKITNTGSSLVFERRSLSGSFTMYGNTDTEVYIPQNMVVKLEAKNTSGGIVVKGLDFIDLSLESSSGNIQADVAKSLGGITMKTTSGSIKAENLEATEALIIGASSGNINVTDVKADRVKASASSGAIKMSEVTSKNVDGDTTSGSIHLEDSAISEKIDLTTTSGGVKFDDISAEEFEFKCTSGSVRGSVKGSKSDYTCRVSTTSGSSNIKEAGNGGKLLTASTTSGSVNISFND